MSDTSPNQQLTEAELQALIDRSRFHQLFQPQVLSIDYEQLQLVIKMPMREEFERQPGTRQWHGGTIAAIIDITGCYALRLITAKLPPTINFRTDYLRPGVATDLTATACVRRAGRTIGVVDVDVIDDAERLIAVGRTCYSVQGSLRLS